MIFRRTKENETVPEVASDGPASAVFVVPEPGGESEELLAGVREMAAGRNVELADPATAIARMREAQVVVSVFQDTPTLDRLLDASVAERKRRVDGFPVLVVVAHLSKLTELGHWLFAGAAADRIEGIRLAVFRAGLARALDQDLAPVIDYEGHLIAGLQPQRIPDLLGDGDLPFHCDCIGHCMESITQLQPVILPLAYLAGSC